LIEYLPSLLNQAIQHYSCFISYSAKDQDFAERLHADLQNKGVRCWFAPHDMPIGGKIRDEIDAWKPHGLLVAVGLIAAALLAIVTTRILGSQRASGPRSA